MKYNVKEIMTRAWEIKRENGSNIFSVCLKASWAEAKAPKFERVIDNTTENREKVHFVPDFDKLIVINFNVKTGTEKQIAYAESLLLKLVNKAAEETDRFISLGKLDSSERRNSLISFVEKVEKFENAVEVINKFKNRV